MTNLLEALYSNAWAITGEKLRDIEAMFQRHSAGEALSDAKVEEIVDQKTEYAFDGMSSFERAEGGLYLRRGDTAYVPLHGTIVNRAGIVARASGAVSPQSVQERLRGAAQDEDVERIVLDIDSPGGTVSGTVPTANTVEEVAGEKEVVAVADNTVASAAYWIGSKADKLVVGESAQVGSIGVIAVHRDKTGKLEEEGIESTIVRVQGDKALGHPEEKFSEEAREVWEERLNGYYELFSKAVADSMGIPETKVREIGSRSYIGRDSVEAGLADEIGSLANVLRNDTPEPNENQYAMSDTSDEESIDSRLSSLESELESERKRADEAEARADKAEDRAEEAEAEASEAKKQAKKATRIAEKHSEALAEKRKSSLEEEALSLVDEEIIGRGKAHNSQRDDILGNCTDEDGEYDADRIELVRNMYSGLAEGSAVPVNDNASSDKGSHRDAGGSGSQEIRNELESNLPSRHASLRE